MGYSWCHLILFVFFSTVLFIVPFYDDPFYVSLLTRIEIFSIAAVSLNLMLGFRGFVSLGHAAFLGIGAYAVGILLHHGHENGWVHLFAAILASLLYSLVTGIAVLRSRGSHFIVATMATAQILFFGIASLEIYGGSDGLTLDQGSEFGLPDSIRSGLALHYSALLFLLFNLFFIHRLIASPFGLIIRGMKENEGRMLALGYNSYPYSFVLYMISGMMCSVAGVFLANFSSFISPDIMHWTRSADLIFMVVLGGLGTAYGSAIGTAAFLLSEHLFSSIWVHWHIIFGFLLVGVALFRGREWNRSFFRWGGHDE